MRRAARNEGGGPMRRVVVGRGSDTKRRDRRSYARLWRAVAALGIGAFIGCADDVTQDRVSGVGTTFSAGPTWQQVSATPRVPSTALAYDSARKRVWHFELDTAPALNPS